MTHHTLRPQSFRLSKSSYIKGMQCAKYLYLHVHRPKEKTPHSAATMQLFRQGRNFESTFRDRFPDSIDVSSELGRDIFSYGASYTRKMLQQNETVTLFEACLIHEEVLVMTDVLVKNPTGDFTIYEIKNAVQPKEVFLWDAALQYYVCHAVLKNISGFNLVLRNEQEGFQIRDITEEVSAQLPAVAERVKQFRELLSSASIPDIPMGNQCTYPYECTFMAYCQQTLF